jgi:hypothetical protein
MLQVSILIYVDIGTDTTDTGAIRETALLVDQYCPASRDIKVH